MFHCRHCDINGLPKVSHQTFITWGKTKGVLMHLIHALWYGPLHVTHICVWCVSILGNWDACLLAPGKKWEKVCKGGLKYGLREKWTTEGNRRKRVYQVERSMRQHRSPKYIFGIDSNLAVYQSYQVWWWTQLNLQLWSKFTYASVRSLQSEEAGRVPIAFRVLWSESLFLTKRLPEKSDQKIQNRLPVPCVLLRN